MRHTAAAVAVLCPAAARAGGDTVCNDVTVPGLIAIVPAYRTARVCHPAAGVPGQRWPVHILMHGNMGGGFAEFTYYGLQEQIAAAGFVVAAPRSCAIDSECNHGRGSFMEALKTLRYLRDTPGAAPAADHALPYSVSGHSTGARAALSLAALRDAPGYLAATRYARLLTAPLREVAGRVAAVVADHPDPMWAGGTATGCDGDCNPDAAHFAVRRTPVLVITGSRDTLEPAGSAWRDFLLLSPPEKVFVNIAGATHLQPILAHPEGAFIAAASQAWALGNATARGLLYGDGVGSLRRALPVAAPGAPNNGNGTIGFLACGPDGVSPSAPGYAAFCNASAPR